MTELASIKRQQPALALLATPSASHKAQLG